MEEKLEKFKIIRAQEKKEEYLLKIKEKVSVMLENSSPIFQKEGILGSNGSDFTLSASPDRKERRNSNPLSPKRKEM